MGEGIHHRGPTLSLKQVTKDREIVFVTIGDEDFGSLLKITAENIRHLYSNANFIIYDRGLSEKERDILAAVGKHVRILPATDQTSLVPGIEITYLENIVKTLCRKLLRFGPNTKRSFTNALSLRRREYIYAQKPYLLLDAVKRYGAPIVYLDADATILGHIDEVLSGGWDLGVTRRPDAELRTGRNQCQVLNAGVLFLNGTRRKVIHILECWCREMSWTCEYLVEQTALTKTVYKITGRTLINSDNFVANGVLNGKKVSIRVLPCSRYNFSKINQGVDSQQHRIVHLKTNRWSKLKEKDQLKEFKVDPRQ